MFPKVLGNAEWQLSNDALGFVGSKNITLAKGQLKKLFLVTNPLSEGNSSKRFELSRVLRETFNSGYQLNVS